MQRSELGAIGRLQFEVLQHRLKDEYACPVLLEPRGFQLARWLGGGWPEPSKYWGELVEDGEGHPATLFENDWQRRTTAEKGLGLTFLEHPSNRLGSSLRTFHRSVCSTVPAP